jgi:hypothetical protein
MDLNMQLADRDCRPALILAIKTGGDAAGGKFNAKSTALLFCLFGKNPSLLLRRWSLTPGLYSISIS